MDPGAAESEGKSRPNPRSVPQERLVVVVAAVVAVGSAAEQPVEAVAVAGWAEVTVEWAAEAAVEATAALRTTTGEHIAG